MSGKELSRVEVMGRVKARSLRLSEAVERLGLSYLQSKRIWARYREGGAQCMLRRCGAGARRLACGRGNGGGNRIAGGGKRRRTLAS